MKQFQERYPVEYDVIVAGGGPAGVAAAVSAARQGAKTALIERYGILGGMLTAGQVQPILGRAEGRTMYNEIVEMLEAGHDNIRRTKTRNGDEIVVIGAEVAYRVAVFLVGIYDMLDAAGYFYYIAVLYYGIAK